MRLSLHPISAMRDPVYSFQMPVHCRHVSWLHRGFLQRRARNANSGGHCAEPGPDYAPSVCRSAVTRIQRVPKPQDTDNWHICHLPPKCWFMLRNLLGQLEVPALYLRGSDDTTLMAGSEEELKSLLKKVREDPRPGSRPSRASPTAGDGRVWARRSSAIHFQG